MHTNFTQKCLECNVYSPISIYVYVFVPVTDHILQSFSEEQFLPRKSKPVAVSFHQVPKGRARPVWRGGPWNDAGITRMEHRAAPATTRAPTWSSGRSSSSRRRTGKKPRGSNQRTRENKRPGRKTTARSASAASAWSRYRSATANPYYSGARASLDTCTGRARGTTSR